MVSGCGVLLVYEHVRQTIIRRQFKNHSVVDWIARKEGHTDNVERKSKWSALCLIVHTKHA